VPPAAAEPEPVVAGDYTRDIRAVLRQKTLHAAAMKRSRFRFHTATPPAWMRGLQFWLRPRPREDVGQREMRILHTTILLSLLAVVASSAEAPSSAGQVRFVTPRGEEDPGPWGKYDTASASDGKIRLRAVWVRSAPAHDILSDKPEGVMS
jgi:hypothetical protein